MILAAIAAPTVNAGTCSQTKTYSTVSITRKTVGDGLVDVTAKGKNISSTGRYMDVYVRKGATKATWTRVASARGFVDVNSSKSAVGSRCDSGKTYWGQCVVYPTSSYTNSLEDNYVKYLE